MSGELRVGIARFGLAGRVFHAPLIAATDGLSIAGVVTRDPERRAQAQAAHPEAVVVASVDELWDDIDVLVVATTNDAHVPLAMQALDREHVDWRTETYAQGHPFLTADAAEHLLEQGAALVGIDSLNIDDTDDGAGPVHTTLLAAGVPICEHLTNLAALPTDGFRFSAVPVKVRAMGTFPVRAYATMGRATRTQRSPGWRPW